MQPSRDQDLVGAGAQAGPNIGQLVLRRKWLLSLFLLVGAGLGYLYYKQQPPVYQSAVLLLVTQNRPALPTAEGRSDAARSDAADLSTQCMVATSPAVLRTAVLDGGLGSRPEFGSPEAAVALISRGLVAEPAELKKARTSVMQISYQGSSPNETLAVVNAVVDAYHKFLGQSDQAVSDETVRLVTQARGELLQELGRLDREYAAFRAESPLLGQGENKINPHAVRLTGLEAERTSLLLRRSQLQAKIDAVREALAKGGSREALALMVSQLREESGSGLVKSEAATVAEKLFPLLLEKELLTENLGADHPKVQSIEKQIQLTRTHLNDIFARDGGRNASGKDLLDVYLDSLAYEIEATDLQETKLQQLLDAETGKARAVEAVLARDRQLSEEIGRKNRLLEAVVKRLDEMSLFATRGIRTQAIAEAGLGSQVPAKRNQFVAIGGLLGLFLAGGLAYLLELSDKSFRTPEDIREEVGAPVIGHIPVIAGDAADLPDAPAPALCTVHAPKSHSAEAFRLVRTAIFFGARGGNLKVIQVTSPDQGDGKSTVSSNLSVAIAQSGRRTLLIDADMRRPTIHRLLKLSNQTGLSEVVGGGVAPPDAIQPTCVANLSVMTCGSRPENPAELLCGSEFDRLLAWARDRFDFVIVDTPPLLAVSDPGSVAGRADGVLLALRLNKQARGRAAEARGILERFGANVIGVVINGVNAKGEYGYRSAYRYSYANNYGYRHGYHYSYGGSNGYTEEPGDGRSPHGNRNGRDEVHLRTMN